MTDTSRPTWAETSDLLRDYYDHEWGMPVRSESGLLERLCLEGFQAGLSWETVLRKRPAFREVFCDFDPDPLAAFTDDDIDRLAADPRIIRNRRKIASAINNAQATVALRADGGLPTFIWSFCPADTIAPITEDDIPTQSAESRALAAALKKRGFSFVGPTTIYAMMTSIGMVDAHLMGSPRRGSSGVF